MRVVRKLYVHGDMVFMLLFIHASLNVSSGHEVLLLQGVLSELRTSRNAVYRTLEQTLTKQGISRVALFESVFRIQSPMRFTRLTGFPIRMASYMNSLLPKTIILKRQRYATQSISSQRPGSLSSFEHKAFISNSVPLPGSTVTPISSITSIPRGPTHPIHIRQYPIHSSRSPTLPPLIDQHPNCAHASTRRKRKETKQREPDTVIRDLSDRSPNHAW
jgi:hypothetical protein